MDTAMLRTWLELARRAPPMVLALPCPADAGATDTTSAVAMPSAIGAACTGATDSAGIKRCIPPPAPSATHTAGSG